MRGPKRFTRVVEDFTCDKCLASVKGTGYTNHCPSCLWSKHVDINPGDRSAVCEGLMEPVLVETEKQDTILTHKCIMCGHTKRNRTSKDDSIEALLAVVKKQNTART
jgi:hypothetical protein